MIALILVIHWFNVYTSAKQFYKCNFSLSEPPYLMRNWTLSSKLSQSPNIVWSHAPHLKINSSLHPNYPKYILSEVKNARINLKAGIVFNEDGCIAKEAWTGKSWLRRSRFLQMTPMGTFRQEEVDHRFVIDEAVYLWGSTYSKDWQHAVIDFLPMYNFVLPFLLQNPAIPVISDSYVKFFQDRFPFNMTKFIPRDFVHKKQGGGTTSPFTVVRRLLFVDIVDRDQSYLLPGSYNRILPFLQKHEPPRGLIQNWMDSLRQSSNHYSAALVEEEERVSQKIISAAFRGAPEKRNLVVYFDRSEFSNVSGPPAPGQLKFNGRSVVEQEALLDRIRRSLKPAFELVVWTCSDYLRDREVVARAAVLIGPHGGHFTNMIFAAKGTEVIELGRMLTLRQIHASYSIKTNSRWVFVGMSHALGLRHWFVEDVAVIKQYATFLRASKDFDKATNIRFKEIDKERKRQYFLKKRGVALPVWSDDNVVVDTRQVTDTLRHIGVSK